jgi:ribosomal RNA-processing protein 17
MRQQRKIDLEKHVNEVNLLMRKAAGEATPSDSSDSEGEFEGFDDDEPASAAPVIEEINREDEYIDEDKYTTVTIEGVNITKEGFESAKDKESEKKAGEVDGEGKKRVWTKEKPKSSAPKKRKKKFRYEAPAERKAARMKQGAKNKAKAQARRGK